MINNFEVCKARALFVKRGILNRDVVPDKIIYSWVRSKLHNISFEILDSPKEKQTLDLLSIDKKTSLFINYIRNINIYGSDVYLIDSAGNLIYKSDQNSLDVPEFSNFGEESIGTSAAGISLATREDMRVYGCEHYNASLKNYVSETIVIEESDEFEGIIICIISKISDFSTHDAIVRRISRDLIKEEETVKIKEEIPVKDADKVVNHVKTAEKIVRVEKCSITEEFCDFNECKVFTLSIVEKNTMLEALDYFSWNMKKTSEALGIGRSTLYRKIKEHKIKKG